jgi:hypothetical protein
MRNVRLLRAWFVALLWFSAAASAGGWQTGVDLHGNPYLYAVPPGAKALLWVFHGSGGSAEACRRLGEISIAVERYHAAGYAVVCVSSHDRLDKQWDLETPDDRANVVAIRTQLGLGVPEFMWGISSGCGFVSTAAVEERRSGVDVRGAVLMLCDGDYLTMYGPELGLVAHWVAQPNDSFGGYLRAIRNHDRYPAHLRALSTGSVEPLTWDRLRARLGSGPARSMSTIRALQDQAVLDRSLGYGTGGYTTCTPVIPARCTGDCAIERRECWKKIDLAAAEAGLAFAAGAIRNQFNIAAAEHTPVDLFINGTDATAASMRLFDAGL